MDLEIVKDALLNALSLLNNEFESVDNSDLSQDYLIAIGKIETALKEIQ